MVLKKEEGRNETQVPRRYVSSLTGLRGVAAMLVFFFHFGALNPGIRADQAVPVMGHALQFPLSFGMAGVDMFFVLSGFLLGFPFAQESLGQGYHRPPWRYFKRRFLRVFPAYYAQLAILLVVGGWFQTWRQLDVSESVAHLFMFFNVGPDPVSPLVGVWWTLPVEFGFYLVLPLLAFFMKPARWVWVLAGSLLLSLVYRQWAVSHFLQEGLQPLFLAASQLPGNLPEFVLGASAAIWIKQRELDKRVTPGPAVLDAMFLIGIGGFVVWLSVFVADAGQHYWTGHWTLMAQPVVLGVSLCAAVSGLYMGSPVGRALLANRVVHFLGLISYSIYLWHVIVMEQLIKVLGEDYQAMHTLEKLSLNLVFMLLVSTVSWQLFERPFYMMGKER